MPYVCVRVTLPFSSVLLNVPVASPKVTVTNLPTKGGVPGPPEVTVTTKVALSVATGLLGVTARLITDFSAPTARASVVDDAEYVASPACNTTQLSYTLLAGGL